MKKWERNTDDFSYKKTQNNKTSLHTVKNTNLTGNIHHDMYILNVLLIQIDIKPIENLMMLVFFTLKWNL